MTVLYALCSRVPKKLLSFVPIVVGAGFKPLAVVTIVRDVRIRNLSTMRNNKRLPDGYCVLWASGVSSTLEGPCIPVERMRRATTDNRKLGYILVHLCVVRDVPYSLI
ncbi:hypothetical protein B0H34DRAFT_119967 [Crassisporium funariophilum]|nr:hypothetical protein B0H34DRAFT_119967 [Crassisporium funariophilum]